MTCSHGKSFRRIIGRTCTPIGEGQSTSEMAACLSTAANSWVLCTVAEKGSAALEQGGTCPCHARLCEAARHVLSHSTLLRRLGCRLLSIAGLGCMALDCGRAIQAAPIPLTGVQLSLQADGRSGAADTSAACKKPHHHRVGSLIQHPAQPAVKIISSVVIRVILESRGVDARLISHPCFQEAANAS